MVKKQYVFIIFFLFINPIVCFPAPPEDNLKGKLIFLGVNHNSTKSVWLSLTSAAGSFKLEGPGKQLIDDWMTDQRDTRLSLSPIVSQGNGGTHHLVNATNNKKLDSQNQTGGIVFPPFPSWQPGTPTHPIVIPPGSAGAPTPPSVIPPGPVGTPTPSQNSAKGNKQTAPLTPGRQTKDENAWNIWSDNYYFGIRDGRNDIDTEGGATNFTLGADRRITNKLVGGISLSTIHLKTTAFNNRLVNNVNGYKVGPYFGYQLMQKWAIDGSINYGDFRNRNKISTLNSQYFTKLGNTTLHALGLYQFGNWQIRPQPLISYTYFRNPSYDFNGTIGNIPIQITKVAEHFKLGIAEFKIETNYTKETKKGNLIQPFTEIGIDYAFVRPSDDQVFSGNLSLASIPKISGLFTIGLRAVFAKKLLIQASGSYLSVGQNNFDLWDARLLISYLFS